MEPLEPHLQGLNRTWKFGLNSTWAKSESVQRWQLWFWADESNWTCRTTKHWGFGSTGPEPSIPDPTWTLLDFWQTSRTNIIQLGLTKPSWSGTYWISRTSRTTVGLCSGSSGLRPWTLYLELTEPNFQQNPNQVCTGPFFGPEPL